MVDASGWQQLLGGFGHDQTGSQYRGEYDIITENYTLGRANRCLHPSFTHIHLSCRFVDQIITEGQGITPKLMGGRLVCPQPCKEVLGEGMVHYLYFTALSNHLHSPALVGISLSCHDHPGTFTGPAVAL